MILIPASDVIDFFELVDLRGHPQTNVIRSYIKNGSYYPIKLEGMSEAYVRNLAHNLPAEEQAKVEEFILAMRKKKN